MNRGRLSLKQSILTRTKLKKLVIYHTTQKFIKKIQSSSAKRIKNLKLQLCRQHFLVEALLVIEPPNIVPPDENAVGTAVILDFSI